MTHGSCACRRRRRRSGWRRQAEEKKGKAGGGGHGGVVYTTLMQILFHLKFVCACLGSGPVIFYLMKPASVHVYLCLRDAWGGRGWRERDRWGCDFRQRVGSDTSAANVWLALVITLLL